ncbi:MAG TPA: 30S ribosomal protein S16, partial [Candidatus Paceibacterota bacterium]
MLKIRMQRSGRINQPSFRIVVTEHASSPKAGKYVERVGFYNPTSKERTLVGDRIKYWMSVGAKPSGTVHNMLVSVGLLNAKKINVLPRKTVPKSVEAEAAPVVAESSDEASETPAEAVETAPEAASVEDSGAPKETPAEE